MKNQNEVLEELRELYRTKKYDEAKKRLKFAGWLLPKEKKEQIEKALEDKGQGIIDFATNNLKWKKL